MTRVLGLGTKALEDEIQDMNWIGSKGPKYLKKCAKISAKPAARKTPKNDHESQQKGETWRRKDELDF